MEGSTIANESILAPFSKQTESFHAPRGIGLLTASHQWLGLAIFSLACPDLAADCHQNSNTYKSHRYALWLQQYKAQFYGNTENRYVHVHLQPFYILTLDMSKIIIYDYTFTASSNFTLAS